MIGTGNVTERKSGPAFNKIPGSKLVAVANRNPARAMDYAKRHGIGTCHTHPLDIIRDPNVHAIYIATPRSLTSNMLWHVLMLENRFTSKNPWRAPMKSAGPSITTP